jgi:penicillin-binding protein-related factor A (putative recombinase)
MTPTKLTGADLERETLVALNKLEDAGIGAFGRYGMQAVRTKDDWQILQSLPDFEGIITGRQIIFDCKACSQASFDLTQYRSETRGSKSRQLRHMIRRSRFGATCGFLLHWNQRELRKSITPAKTYWIPIDYNSQYWVDVDGGVIRSISLADCSLIGIEIPWVIEGRDRKAKLDLRWLFTFALQELSRKQVV